VLDPGRFPEDEFEPMSERGMGMVNVANNGRENGRRGWLAVGIPGSRVSGVARDTQGGNGAHTCATSNSPYAA